MCQSRLRLLLVVVCSLLAASPALARQVRLLDKGDDLARLDRFIGDWEGELTRVLPGGRELVLHPHVTYSWDLGGVWLLGEDTVELPTGDIIINREWVTWHARDEVYRGAWQDNVFPDLLPFAATWTDDDTLTFDSGVTQINDRDHRIVLTVSFEGDDTYRTEMRQSWDDGPLNVVAKADFRRVDAGATLPEAFGPWRSILGDWSLQTRRYSFEGEVVEAETGSATFSVAPDGWRIIEHERTTILGAPQDALHIFAVNPENASLEWARTDTGHHTLSVWTGDLTEDRITLTQKHVNPEHSVLRRMEYARESEDQLVRRLYFSTDDGDTWFVRFEAEYSRAASGD